MSVHSIQRKKRRDPTRVRYKTMGSHDEFLSRITKTLYYGQLPHTDRFSLPVTELAAELFSEVKSGRSLDRLRLEEAAEISRNACVSPCSFVLAMLYLERLKICNPEFLDQVSSSNLFLVSSLVASKFLNDDGVEDEVFNAEWATSAGMELKELNKLEVEFLDAINWEVYVKEISFWKQLETLEKEIAFKQGKRRGWFSYTDLDRLLNSVNTIALAHTLLSVSAVCLAAYTAGLLTVVGSTAIVASLPLSPVRTAAPTAPVVLNYRPSNRINNSTCLPSTELKDLPPNKRSSELLNSCSPSNNSNSYGGISSTVSDYIINTVTRPFLPYIHIVATR